MKKEILTAPFVKEMMKTTYNLWKNGWDERNGGNISYILDENEVKEYIDIEKSRKSMKLTTQLKALSGKIFIVTGSGKYFKNVIDDPENNIGIIKVDADGKGYDILWGLEDDSVPTSELAAHFMSHISRLKKDDEHKVVMHTHATNVIAMTFFHDLDENKFTKTLWEMCTECLVVFPEGIGIIPWMLPGSEEIGKATAEKMNEYRTVIWPHHGIFVTGNTMDEAFGLVETIEKAADICIKVSSCGGKKQTITDEELKILANGFGVGPKEGILK